MGRASDPSVAAIARLILTFPHHGFAPRSVPIQTVPSSNIAFSWTFGRAAAIISAGRGGFDDESKFDRGTEMRRLGIALCALLVLVFTGGLNPEPQHEGLLLLSLTILLYMAAFSATKKKQKS